MLFRGFLFLVAIGMLTGCATKWVPDTESPLNPPVAYQQKFIVDALDQAISTMNFSRLSGDLVDIEVSGVYVDGDIADYLRSKIQVELAKAGAKSESTWGSDEYSHKMNVMVRVGGVNDLAKTMPFYEWRQKVFTYDIDVGVFSLDGSEYFEQSGKGETKVTVAKRLYIGFIPIPLPSEWSTSKGVTLFQQASDTYNASKQVKMSNSALWDINQIPQGLGN